MQVVATAETDLQGQKMQVVAIGETDVAAREEISGTCHVSVEQVRALGALVFGGRNVALWRSCWKKLGD